jgi:hypothetical protein
MTWLEASRADIPSTGTIRSVGGQDRRAYHRAYYHTKRKGRVKQVYTPKQMARRTERRRELYWANLERERATGRASYWRNRDRNAAAARERARAKRARASV